VLLMAGDSTTGAAGAIELKAANGSPAGLRVSDAGIELTGGPGGIALGGAPNDGAYQLCVTATGLLGRCNGQLGVACTSCTAFTS